MKTFEIFDVNKPLLEKNIIIQAKTHIEAAKKYCIDKYNKIPKRSGSNYVQISVFEIINCDGTQFRKGNIIWYELN